MSERQIVSSLLYAFWAALIWWHAWAVKLERAAIIPYPGYVLGPQQRKGSACERWQFCDEWRTPGPDGRMIERRVI